MAPGSSRALPLPQASETVDRFRARSRVRMAHAVLWLAAVTFAVSSVYQSIEFATIHGFVRSLALASMLCVALLAASAVTAFLLNFLAVLNKLLLGGALVGSLTFAQNLDPSAQQPARTGDAEPALQRRSLDVSAYAGGSITGRSDLSLRQPGGTDLLLKDVQWRSESTQTEPYWGARLTYWSRRKPMLGAMLDYTHAKTILWHRQSPIQSGTRDGEPVPSPESVTKTFRRLDFTHGLNFATLNGVVRFRGLHPRITPYVGIGFGASVPHVYMQRAGQSKDTRTYKHMITGPTFQVLAGVDWRVFIADQFSWFTEYKLNHSRNNARLKGGGSLKTNLWTHQIIPVGFTYRPPLPGRAK